MSGSLRIFHGARLMRPVEPVAVTESQIKIAAPLIDVRPGKSAAVTCDLVDKDQGRMIGGTTRPLALNHEVCFFRIKFNPPCPPQHRFDHVPAIGNAHENAGLSYDEGAVLIKAVFQLP